VVHRIRLHMGIWLQWHRKKERKKDSGTDYFRYLTEVRDSLISERSLTVEKPRDLDVLHRCERDMMMLALLLFKHTQKKVFEKEPPEAFLPLDSH